MRRPLHRPTHRRAFAAVAFTALTAAGLTIAVSPSTARAEAALAAASESQPDLILVKFHADWCPVCRSLDGPFAELADELAGSDVLFVRLDQTDKAKKHQAELHLGALGLGEHGEAFLGKTGQMALFNGATGEVVKVYSGRDGAASIAKDVRARAKG